MPLTDAQRDPRLRYPLDVKNFSDLGWAYSKGHHDTQVFCDHLSVGWNIHVPLWKILHTWHRVGFFEGGPDRCLYPADGPGPGVFPTTEVKYD